MAKKIVTCKKCGKIFDYMKTDGICPKCARYYSTTHYNEEEALLDNILAPANEEKCSYHGGHDKTPGMSGHFEDHYNSGRELEKLFNRPATSKSTKKMAIVVTIIFIFFIEFLLSIVK